MQEYLAGLQPDPTAFLFVLGTTHIGATLTTVMSLLFISSAFAALGIPQRRQAVPPYALGREGLVPNGSAAPTPSTQPGYAGSLSQTILAFVVVLIFVITGQDPVLALFTWLTQLGTLAIIVLMALASFAVVAFFARHRDPTGRLHGRGADRRRRGDRCGHLRGVAVRPADRQSGEPAALILPALIVVAAIAGVIAAISLKNRSPEMYAQMGRHRDIELRRHVGRWRRSRGEMQWPPHSR